VDYVTMDFATIDTTTKDITIMDYAKKYSVTIDPGTLYSGTMELQQ